MTFSAGAVVGVLSFVFVPLLVNSPERRFRNAMPEVEIGTVKSTWQSSAVLTFLGDGYSVWAFKLELAKALAPADGCPSGFRSSLLRETDVWRSMREFIGGEGDEPACTKEVAQTVDFVESVTFTENHGYLFEIYR